MAIQRGSTAQTSETSKHTLRLTFKYERTNVQLVAVQRIEMISPPSELETIHQGQAGFWAELRDPEERVLYQRVLHNPIRYEFEVPEDAETGALRWQKIAYPQGTFQLLLPDIPDGQTLVLFGSPPEAISEPATELARFTGLKP
jgi:hypothetical protein